MKKGCVPAARQGTLWLLLATMPAGGGGRVTVFLVQVQNQLAGVPEKGRDSRASQPPTHFSLLAPWPDSNALSRRAFLGGHKCGPPLLGCSSNPGGPLVVPLQQQHICVNILNHAEQFQRG